LGFLFSDVIFSFETLRTIGHATYGGADPGEVIATSRTIKEGDDDSWLRAWQATAERVHALADGSLAQGHHVNAHQAYLRASNYYRGAEFFRRARPIDDQLVLTLSRKSRETFASAMKIVRFPFRQLEIPYENTVLPGYLWCAGDSGTARPTVIYTNGFDSTAEESWFAIAAAALERGYNVLAYDGPGQGAVIREQCLQFRPDWEAVLGRVIDFALAQPEVDDAGIALFGYSFGAYLVARTAAFDDRAAALILDDGMHDFHEAYSRKLPQWLVRLVNAGRGDRITNSLIRLRARSDTQVRWGINHGHWTIGGQSYADYLRRIRAYSLGGLIECIRTPTLILDAEKDGFLKGQARVLADTMVASTKFVQLTSDEGAGDHCHVGSLLRAHQVIFDWLEGSTPPYNPLTTEDFLINHLEM
jgi:pimeloyl-ACP methyl ester carboxylesterase